MHSSKPKGLVKKVSRLYGIQDQPAVIGCSASGQKESNCGDEGERMSIITFNIAQA